MSKYLILSGLLFVSPFFIASALADPPLPNVIYIMLDDLGPGEYSSYNNLQGLGQTSKIATPNIDQLAAQGMRFNNAHAATALCAPTRAAVMAGAPTWQTNVRWGFGSSSLQTGQQSVGDLMQAAGYNTALMGKGHLGGQVYEIGSDNAAGNGFSNIPNMDFDRPLRNGMKGHGYDYTFNMIAGIQARPYVFWEDDLATITDADGNSTRIDNSNKLTMTRQWDAGYDDGVTEIWTGAGGWGAVDWKTRDVPQAMLNKAVDFMDGNVTNTPNEPFFLHYNSVAGHWPYVAPPSVQVDINGDGDTSDPGEFYNVDGYDGSGPAPDDLGTESMQMVSVSDAEVGVLVSYLEQTDDPRNPGHKLIDNTMIIYTSDNGGIGPNYTNQHGPLDRDEWDVYGHDSTAGLLENKASSHEGGHRVPFIVQWKDQVEAGSVRDQRVSNIDLMGTLAGLTGQSLIDQGQGSHNLLPVFTGERDDSDPVRKNLVVEDTGGASDGQISRKLYYEGNWKLSVGAGNATSPTIHEFFDLATDPGETTNLVSSSDPGIQQRITDMYANYIAERNATRMAPVLVGKNSTVDVQAATGLGDVEVEGVFEGQGVVSGSLDLNNNGTLRIVPGVSSSTQSIAATQDIRLDDDGGQYNSNSRISLGRDVDGGLQRSALEFDLTTINVPVGASIANVELVFTVGFGWAPAESDSPTIEVHPLTRDFDETTATWFDAENGVAWTTPGGDFDGSTLLAEGSGFDPDTVNGGDQIVVGAGSFTTDVIANLSSADYQLMVKYDDLSELSGAINGIWLNSNNKGNPPTQLVVTFDAVSTERSITVNGDFTQRAGATLELSLGAGTTAGFDYDQLIVSGEIDLMGGELAILLDAGFTPSLGDVFDVLDFSSLSGSFDSISMPVLGPNLSWGTKDLLTTGEIRVIAAGDFDEDGDVDEDDLMSWSSGYNASGLATRADGDSNGDGMVNGIDLLVWQQTYTGSVTTVTSVPEPASALLAVLFPLHLCVRRSRN